MSEIAPSYDVLYDFESQLESAFAAFLESITETPCHIQRGGAELVPPCYEFQFTNGAATPHEGIARDNRLYPDAFNGALRVRHVTVRKDDFTLADHRRGVARMRRHCYQFMLYAPQTLLPYLGVSDVRESGSLQGIDPERQWDITELTFAVAFYIRPGSWPVNLT